MSKIFDGIKVLDFTSNAAGPCAAAMLADHGAEVIKIERPGVGDDARVYAPKLYGTALNFNWYNRGKKSITLDLKDPEAKAIIEKMIVDADILMESYRPGIMKKMGLDYDEVIKINPQIIYCSVSAFGQYGPYSMKPGYDVIAQGMSGLVDCTGNPDGEPIKHGVILGDFVGSLNAYGAIVTALYNKKITGEGQYIDVSLFEGLFAFNGNFEKATMLDMNPTRTGNHHPSIAPYGVFEGKNKQYCVIATPNNKHWKILCEIMGKPELITHEIFGDVAKRGLAHEQVKDIIEDWLKGFDDIKVPVDMIDKAGVPCAKIMTTKELTKDEHLIARGSIVEIDAPESYKKNGLEKLTVRGPWIKYSKTPMEMKGVPDLGQHNYEVLGRYGLSKEEVDKLQAKWNK